MKFKSKRAQAAHDEIVECGTEIIAVRHMDMKRTDSKRIPWDVLARAIEVGAMIEIEEARTPPTRPVFDYYASETREAQAICEHEWDVVIRVDQPSQQWVCRKCGLVTYDPPPEPPKCEHEWWKVGSRWECSHCPEKREKQPEGWHEATPKRGGSGAV